MFPWLTRQTDKFIHSLCTITVPDNQFQYQHNNQMVDQHMKMKSFDMFDELQLHFDSIRL